MKNKKEQKEKKTTKLIEEVDLKSLISKEETEPWENQLELTKNSNKIVHSYVNSVLLWENHPILKDIDIKYNEFFRQIEIDGEPMNNTTRAIIRTKFEAAGGFYNVQKTNDFLDAYSYKFKYNPVLNYLETIKDKRDENIKCRNAFIDWFDIEYENETEKHNICTFVAEKCSINSIA